MRIVKALAAVFVSISERCEASDPVTEELTTTTTEELPTSMDGATEASILCASLVSVLAVAVLNN